MSDHSDFLYLEQCMSHLGDFLSELNGSIEQSMAAVAVAQEMSPSPKPKRRFQLSTLSFQSILETSHNQSIVAEQLPRKSRLKPFHLKQIIYLIALLSSLFR